MTAGAVTWLREQHAAVLMEQARDAAYTDVPSPISARVRNERLALDDHPTVREVLVLAWGWRTRPGYLPAWKPGRARAAKGTT